MSLWWERASGAPAPTEPTDGAVVRYMRRATGAVVLAERDDWPLNQTQYQAAGSAGTLVRRGRQLLAALVGVLTVYTIVGAYQAMLAPGGIGRGVVGMAVGAVALGVAIAVLRGRRPARCPVAPDRRWYPRHPTGQPPLTWAELVDQAERLIVFVPAPPPTGGWVTRPHRTYP